MAFLNHIVFKLGLSLIIFFQLFSSNKLLNNIRETDDNLYEVNSLVENVVSQKEVVLAQIHDLDTSYEEIFTHLAYKSYRHVNKNSIYTTLPHALDEKIDSDTLS